MKQILEKLINHIDLTQDEMREAFDRLMTGEMTQAQISAFIALLCITQKSASAVAGAASSMRRHATLIDTGGIPVVDTCGTGGDNTNTFNISTASAFVVTGAGVPVAKHGNKAVSSKCGSADVLTELGLNIKAAPEIVEDCLNNVGIGFLFAPLLHPAMKYATPVRRELGIRTIFNMLGPLTNPAGATGQILGVFSPDLTELFANVLRTLGSKRVFVVYGNDGMDEITVTTTTSISELKNGKITTYEFDPLPFIGQYHKIEKLAGGTSTYNADIIRRVLSGERGACRDIVLLNAAAGIIAGEKADTFEVGFQKARESIDSGSAANILKKLLQQIS